MTTYAIFARRADEAPASVPEAFSWAAALVPPLYAMAHGLWLEFVGWGVALAAIVGLAQLIGGEAAFWLYVLLAIFIGFEAAAFRRGALLSRRLALRRRDRRAGGRCRRSRVDQAAAEMSTVAIIDYGSGNLRSAAKAFERAARDVSRRRRDRRHLRPRGGARAPTASCCPASAPSPIAARDSMPSTAWSRCSRSASSASGMPFLGICVGMQLMATEGREKTITAGLGWIAGAVVRIEPKGGLKVPHMGWNTLTFAQAAPAARRHPRRRRWAARLLRPLLSPRDRAARDADRHCRLRSGGDGDRRPRQPVRHAVPPREEPDPRADADRQFPRGGRRDPLSRDRSQGRQVRAAEARRHGRRRRCSTTTRRRRRRRSRTRGSSICTSSISTAPLPGESVNGEAVEAILRAVKMPVQLGGGIRTIAHIEHWLGARPGPRHPRHGGGARPGAGAPGGATVPRPGRGRHRRARRQGRGRGLGRDLGAFGASSSRSASRARASRRSSTPTSTATASSPASTGRRRWSWRGP